MFGANIYPQVKASLREILVHAKLKENTGLDVELPLIIINKWLNLAIKQLAIQCLRGKW